MVFAVAHSDRAMWAWLVWSEIFDGGVMGPPGSHKRYRFGLTSKLILAILLTGTIPIIVGLSVAYMKGTAQLREVIGSSFQALAQDSASKLDGELQELVEADQALAMQAALDPELRRILETTGTGDGAGGELAAQADWPPIGTLGPPGLLISRVTKAVTASNGPHVIGLHLEQERQRFAFRIETPIKDPQDGTLLGWLKRSYDAREILNPLVFPIRFGRTGHVMLVDNQGTVISCPLLPTGTRLANADLIAGVSVDNVGWLAANSDGHGGHATSLIGHAPLTWINRMLTDDVVWATFVWQDSKEVFAPAASLRMGFVLAGALALSMLGVLGYYASGRIVRPIQRLREEAGRIAGGDLEPSPIIRSGDEIEDLSDQLNDMREQLRNFIDNLEDTVETRTRELRDTQAEKDQVVEQLIQAEKLAAVGTMASGIGHEINNPLYAILGRAEAIRDSTDLARCHEYGQVILDHSKRIAQIVKDLSGYARPGDGEMEPVDVNRPLAEALAMARHPALSDNMEIRQSFAEVPPILAKKDELQQAFFNVIRNGLQAMEDGGTLEIVSRLEGDVVEVSVADTGPGIPEDDIGKVFDPFFTTKDPDQGEGLGLYLVRTIVKKYGGTISAANQERGGAVFCFRFPVEGNP
jgi:signal transduction histidine kinase